MINGICLGNVTVDCDDGQKLCDFYHQLLGWEKRTMFGCPALLSNKGVTLLFIEEADYVPPIWPEEDGRQQKQMHFDFQVPDVQTAAEYAKSLGATQAAEQFGAGEFVTMLDPSGHPFCLCASDNIP